MTPEEIQGRLNDPNFVVSVFALAASERPSDPGLHPQYDAAQAIATLYGEISDGTFVDASPAYERLGGLLESYVLTYG